MDKNIYLTDEQYFEQLNKYKQRIIDRKIPLTMYDDDTIGSKDSGTSWGLCNSDKAMWPVEMRLWGDDPRDAKRDTVYGTKYLGKYHQCPFDRDLLNSANNEPGGCFCRCLLFSGELKGHEHVRAERLFDEAIRQHNQRMEVKDAQSRKT